MGKAVIFKNTFIFLTQILNLFLNIYNEIIFLKNLHQGLPETDVG